jgi:hypothetical protein
MAIEKETSISQIEVVGEFKAIQIATDTIIKEDGVEISRTRHRKVINSDQDISNEDEEVKKIANIVWTPKIKTAWVEYKESEINNID